MVMNTQPHNSLKDMQQSNETPLLDLDSDEPMQACPLRKDGLAPGETCEACQ